MVKYEYRPDLEMFRRVDNRGYSLKFNITEARRIETMMNLGMSAYSILNKVDFVNDVSEQNIRTFMKNLKMGNIDLDGDYPVPSERFESISLEERIDNLESRMDELENSIFAEEDISIKDKVKSWLKN